MKILTIEIPDHAETTLIDFITQLGGNVISKGNTIETYQRRLLSPKEKKFLKGFDGAIDFVNLHQEGKVKAKIIDQLLCELAEAI